MKIQKRRYELTDDDWERICSLFPAPRTTVNGIIWLARSGAPWRDMVNGIQSTNALQNSRSMEFSKKYSMNSELRPTCKISA